MENLDVLFPNVKTVKIGTKDFKIAPLGPYLMGQIIDYVKDKRRAAIVKSAKEIGTITLSDLSRAINEDAENISPNVLDLAMGDEDIMTHFVFFDLQVYQPELTYTDMGKLIDLENIHEIVAKILGDKTENFPKASPKEEKPS